MAFGVLWICVGFSQDREEEMSWSCMDKEDLGEVWKRETAIRIHCKKNIVQLKVLLKLVNLDFYK